MNYIFFNNDSIKNYHGALTYTHKVKEGHDVYFVSNSTGETINTNVVLRGKMELGIWDPLTGESRKIESDHRVEDGFDMTEFRLELKGPQALFFVTL